MSEFRCDVVRVEVVAHPGADRLEVARVGGFECVVPKGQFGSGDLAVYLPEGSVVPEEVLDELGLRGRLAGAAANRVKAMRLRGVVSQGLLLPVSSRLLADAGTWAVGDDVTDLLGVVKWVPPIPVHMAGGVEPCPSKGFDVESWQRHPGVLEPGERVQVTEKLHGTFCLLSFDLEHGPIVASKGMTGRTRFRLDTDENDENLYVRVGRGFLDGIEAEAMSRGVSVSVFGEIVGPKVQDLSYGLAEPTLFVFDAFAGVPAASGWLPPADTADLAGRLGVRHVPVVADDVPFDQDAVVAAAADPSLLDGGLREGVVVRSTSCRRDISLGRVILKYVNPAYLTRRGGTEHN